MFYSTLSHNLNNIKSFWEMRFIIIAIMRIDERSNIGCDFKETAALISSPLHMLPAQEQTLNFDSIAFSLSLLSPPLPLLVLEWGSCEALNVWQKLCCLNAPTVPLLL